MEPDPNLQNFFGSLDEIVTYPVEPVPRGFWKKIWRWFLLPKARDDGVEQHHRVCPYCHMELPPAIARGKRQENIIAIIGRRSSGKSTYIAMLLYQLMHRYSGEGKLDFSIHEQDTFTYGTATERVSSMVLFNQRYGPLFQKPMKMIPQTSSVRSNPENRLPLIFRLTFHVPSIFLSCLTLGFKKTYRQSVDLIFYDAAGEDLENTTTMELFGRYIIGAQGILALEDPMENDALRNLILGTTKNPEIRKKLMEKNASAEVNNTIISPILNHFNKIGRTTITVPTAYVYTKFDQLSEALAEDSRIFQDRTYVEGFDPRKCDEVAKEIENLLEKGQIGYVDMLMKHFRRYQFFAVSSLGHSPEERANGELRPLNVGDPLFWLLNHLRCLPAAVAENDSVPKWPDSKTHMLKRLYRRFSAWMRKNFKKGESHP